MAAAAAQPVAVKDVWLEEPAALAFLQKEASPNWTQGDFDRRGLDGCPNPRPMMRPSVYGGERVENRVEWSRNALRAWIAAQRVDLERKQRLFGSPKR